MGFQFLFAEAAISLTAVGGWGAQCKLQVQDLRLFPIKPWVLTLFKGSSALYPLTRASAFSGGEFAAEKYKDGF